MLIITIQEYYLDKWNIYAVTYGAVKPNYYAQMDLLKGAIDV